MLVFLGVVVLGVGWRVGIGWSVALDMVKGLSV